MTANLVHRCVRELAAGRIASDQLVTTRCPVCFLSLRHIFGLKADVSSCLGYVDENVLVYPAGHNTVIYNTEDRKQKFIHGTEGTDGISAMAVCPSKR